MKNIFLIVFYISFTFTTKIVNSYICSDDSRIKCTADKFPKGLTIKKVFELDWTEEQKMKAVEKAFQLFGAKGIGSYKGGSVKRDKFEGGQVLDVSSGAPANLPVIFHNEMAYSMAPPELVAFVCFKRAEVGGLTKIAENSRVLSLLSEDLVTKLKTLGLQYIRNFADKNFKSPLGIPVYHTWQSYFEEEDINKVISQVNQQENDKAIILEDGGIQIMMTRPAFIAHPPSGKEVFFSSVIDYHGFLYDEYEDKPFSKLPYNLRPFHCLWGDGSEITDEEIGEMRKAFDDSTLFIQLKEGEMMFIENLLLSHGRTSYEGKRKVGVLISPNVHRKELERQMLNREEL